MLRLPKKLQFAIEAVLDVAVHEGDGLVRSIDMAERAGIPERYLEPVLQVLTRERILSSTRGPAGGYALGRPANRISLGDIIRAARGEEPDEPAGHGSDLHKRVLQPLWRDMDASVANLFDGISIADLVERAVARRRTRR